jgi:hypothetical protein
LLCPHHFKMILTPCKYNHELFQIASHGNVLDVDCECNTPIFDNHGKKYIELNVGDSDECVAFLTSLERAMNDRFRTQQIVPYTIVAKLPFRYGRFELKVSDEEGYLHTTDDVRANTRLRVRLEVTSVYDYGVHWMVRHITVLNI